MPIAYDIVEGIPAVYTTPETKIMHDEAGTDPDFAGQVNATKAGNDGELW